MKTDPDVQFFLSFPDRQARIRTPFKVPTVTPQRAVRMMDECQGEFWSLGDHDRTRRRILVWRVPRDSPYYAPDKRPLLKIPFLAFSDEDIADRDDILLPLIHRIMLEAAQTHGMAQ